MFPPQQRLSSERWELEFVRLQTQQTRADAEPARSRHDSEIDFLQKQVHETTTDAKTARSSYGQEQETLRLQWALKWPPYHKLRGLCKNHTATWSLWATGGPTSASWQLNSKPEALRRRLEKRCAVEGLRMTSRSERPHQKLHTVGSKKVGLWIPGLSRSLQ